MKNKVLLLIVPFILLILISAIIPKPKNDQAGGIIGRAILEVTNDWKANPHTTFKAGRYYDLTIVLVEKLSNKRIVTKADKFGYFAFLNLPQGNYEITECNLEDYMQSEYIWTFPHSFKNTYDSSHKDYKENIKKKYGFILVTEKQISVLNPLTIILTLTKTYSHEASGYYKYEIDYEYDSVINNFKDKDKNSRWADFTLFKHDEEIKQ